MIGTIRKHSKALWWILGGATVISFLWWNIAPAQRNSGVSAGNYGSLYGQPVTRQEYVNATHEFDLFYWFRNHEWPDKNPNLKQKDMDQQIYLRLMLTRKAHSLGIYVGDQAAATAANDMLRSLGRDGQSVPLGVFDQEILEPAGLTIADFERFARDDVAIQQLIRTVGITGRFVTPQEAAVVYTREHQDMKAQAVFFSASNYLAQVASTPAEIAQFYTNYLAQYRLPDRVQVNYVEFNLSNYLEQAKTQLAKTNLDAIVEQEYQKLGPDYFPDAKTPAAAKAKIRGLVIRQRAMNDARAKADAFATQVFSMNPVMAANLATVAREKGLTVQLTPPFSSSYGPQDDPELQVLTKSAFDLTTDDPLAGPIQGASAYFVIALAKKLPSEIPPLARIRDRVRQDYRTVQAILLAQRAGTNFTARLTRLMSADHTFASACRAAGVRPETLPPFSLTTQDLPDLGERVPLTEFLRAAANTPPGHTSPFVQTEDGGFVVHVQSRLPVDRAAMNANLPQFTAQLRQARENEVFNEWLQTEANRELRNTPVFAEQTARAQ